MSEKGPVQYVRDTAQGFEAILCRDSEISYPMHTHVSVFTAGQVLSGKVRFVSGGLCRDLGPGQDFLVFPHMPHRIEAREPYSLLCLCVRADVLAGDRGEPGGADVQRLVASLENDMLRPLQTLWNTVSGCPVPSPLPPLIKDVEQRLERFPEEALRIVDLARLAYMSEFHFIRAFRQAAGLTPHRFQMQNRVRKGQRLLSGGASVAEAALAAGFCDQSHFTRCFKRLTGLTPAAYEVCCTNLAPLR